MAHIYIDSVHFCTENIGIKGLQRFLLWRKMALIITFSVGEDSGNVKEI